MRPALQEFLRYLGGLQLVKYLPFRRGQGRLEAGDQDGRVSNQAFDILGGTQSLIEHFPDESDKDAANDRGQQCSRYIQWDVGTRWQVEHARSIDNLHVAQLRAGGNRRFFDLLIKIVVQSRIRLDFFLE